ncbi:MAG: glutamate 5-kinase [Gemmatales bacterium]
MSFSIDPVRQEVLALAHTIVVKVGTNVLTLADGRLNHDRLRGLASQLHRIRQLGKQVVLVSSGAIGAGIGLLQLPGRPTDLRRLQAAAAVGQCALMAAYEEYFSPFGYHASQLLLTASDFDHRSRCLNVRNTIMTLFEWNCIPVINENDTVSVAEIKFGDNDQLAAMVTNLLRAPLLILLTNVDGLYSADPGQDASATLLPTVSEIDARVTSLAGETRSSLGSGGMRSKLKAARLVTIAGDSVIMANGAAPNILEDILSAKPVGTLFLPRGGLVSARKRWIGLIAKPRGKLVVDVGASTALTQKGKSLLPIGITDVAGHFSKGDVVSIVDHEGTELARGLSNYAAGDIWQLRGKRSEEVQSMLGRRAYEEVVHRDNLVLLH